MGGYLRVGAYLRGRLLDIPVSRVGSYSRMALNRSIAVKEKDNMRLRIRREELMSIVNENL